ncbi:ABC transporter permease [Pseudoflavitalea sp. G-6-1-2]|uniref:ABC transporter permease n=1 Tax=Pseudoflavitalea sp. G-6-1-2 TaxID=2728841 RepID=UPI00146B96C9|nr:ABC transporter permease [Pseudoflavitalea sp. G-6-1-2]NML22075.1 ABC transporter permease [Pseudoflavitalea sp. G-6-1-2]
MRNFGRLITRELRLFWSNKVFVVAFLFMPFVLAFVLGNVYKKGKVTDLPVVLIDNDQTPASDKFGTMIEDHQQLKIVHQDFELGDVQQMMLTYRAVAVIVIPDRFEANLLAQRMPEINCYLNMSNTLTAGSAGTAVSVVAGTMNAGILISSYQKRGMPASIASKQYESFKHNVFYEYNPAGNYLYFLWPGLIFSIIQQLLLLALGVSFSQEIANGTFSKDGLLSYSRSPLVLILAKILPYSVLGMMNIGVFYLLSIYFKVPMPWHPGVLLAAQVLLVIGSSLLGTLYSVVFPSPLKASELLMSIASPAFTISGFTWPQVPSVLQTISMAIPLTPYLQLMRMTLFQNADWMDVWPQLKHMLILIAVFLFLTWLLLFFRIRKVLKSESNNLPATAPA